ncbi:hypothetical protein LC593_22685 [Nostoc sp. CHAB 5844]|nr:hypothetical protein [Nostoc sp. CHAB 5844]
MTDTPDSVNRIELIERLLLRISEQQALNTEAIADLAQENREQQAINNDAIANLTQEVRELTSDTNRVLGRSAILDDVLLELRESAEEHRQAFVEHQRTTNAALASLEAILVQLISRNS